MLHHTQASGNGKTIFICIYFNLSSKIPLAKLMRYLMSVIGASCFPPLDPTRTPWLWKMRQGRNRSLFQNSDPHGSCSSCSGHCRWTPSAVRGVILGSWRIARHHDSTTHRSSHGGLCLLLPGPQSWWLSSQWMSSMLATPSQHLLPRGAFSNTLGNNLPPPLGVVWRLNTSSLDLKAKNLHPAPSETIQSNCPTRT